MKLDELDGDEHRVWDTGDLGSQHGEIGLGHRHQNPYQEEHSCHQGYPLAPGQLPAQGFPHRHHGHIRTQGEQSHPHHQEHRPGQKQQQGLQGYWRCRHSQEQNDQTDRQHAGQGLVGLFLQRFVDDDNPSLFSVFAI